MYQELKDTDRLSLIAEPTRLRRGANGRLIGRATLVDVFSPAQKIQFGVLLGVWTTTVVAFWLWWCQASHVVGWMRFALNSAVLCWTLLLPGYFFFFVSRMKKSDPRTRIPTSWRVAIVVTKAPCEPFSVVRRTLERILAQEFPHDTWLADEDPTPQVERWCREHGVQISSRNGITDYHRSEWPRRTKCKEGNLAYFYDTYGYDLYDFVCQLDADHEPSEGYLEAMLRPFVDAKVGYVSAPSICDKNAEQSWTARARLYSEAIMHGPLQAGYSAGFAPLCIGSHYAVRTSALREIGGLGPELAEDHSTTLLMNAGGWKGVHALDAEAHGDGPHSFADCMMQEFQWSRSLTTLLLTLTLRCWRKLPARLLCQFLFSQLWYPIFGGVMLLSFALPLIAIGTRTPWVRISYVQFLAGALLVNATLIAITSWLRRTGCLRPTRPKLISWEIFVFQFGRWPWVICGITAGIYGAIRRKTWQFRVTPKDPRQSELAFCLILPPLILALISSLVTLMCEAGDAAGYYFFSILNSFAYTAVLGVIIKKHGDENQDPAAKGSRGRYGILCWGIAAGVLLLSVLGVWCRGRDALERILGTPPPSREIAATGRTPSPPDHLSVFRWGVYDPDQLLQAREGFSLEHVFLSWATLDPDWLAEQLTSIDQRNRVPLITLEPWADAKQEKTPGTLFDDILAGEYDSVLDTFAETVRNSGTWAFVRWGHEMENLIGRYPWITRDHAAFIEVYRYVVDRLRSRADNVVFVWSPAGNRECPAYWPGDDYVDVVGLSILCFPDWERREHGRIRSFEEMFSEKYDRVSRFGHPVMIAEFGVSGSNGHQLAWLREAFVALSDYPLLKSIVFYFTRDIDGAWGEDLATPDWRFPLTTLDEVKQALTDPG